MAEITKSRGRPRTRNAQRSNMDIKQAISKHVQSYKVRYTLWELNGTYHMRTRPSSIHTMEHVIDSLIIEHGGIRYATYAVNDGLGRSSHCFAFQVHA